MRKPQYFKGVDKDWTYFQDLLSGAIVACVYAGSRSNIGLRNKIDKSAEKTGALRQPVENRTGSWAWWRGKRIIEDVADFMEADFLIDGVGNRIINIGEKHTEAVAALQDFPA